MSMSIQRIISGGFAACAFASASLPAMSWDAWPNSDFEWYASAGKSLSSSSDGGVEANAVSPYTTDPTIVRHRGPTQPEAYPVDSMDRR